MPLLSIQHSSVPPAGHEERMGFFPATLLSAPRLRQGFLSQLPAELLLAAPSRT
jgi:hypothetical protein